MTLTAKQKRFCDEYLLDLNATAAYQRAGYKGSDATARPSASKLLTNHNIQSRIAELQAERSQRTQINADRVLKEIAHVAFADISDVVTWTENSVSVIGSKDLKPKVTAAIAEMVMSETQTESGVTRQIKVKMHDKLKALGKLADHLGLNFSLDDMVNAVLAQGYAVANPALTQTNEADPLAEIEGIN